MNSAQKPPSPQTPSTHWAQLTEAGAVSGLRFMFGCFKLGGRPLFRVMLIPVILYFFLFNHRARQASRDWLRRMKECGAVRGGWMPWLGYRHFWQFGIALIDKVAVWKGKIGIKDVVVENGEIIHQLLDERRGAVLVISHLGNFEVCRCLSARHPHMRLTVMVHAKNSRKFNHFFREQIGHCHTDLLQVTEITPATAMLLSERVERGEFVVIAGDRIPVNSPDNSISTRFFGELAPFPAGPFTLAAILRVPLVTVFCTRALQDHGRYHIGFQWLSQAVQVSRRERARHLQSLVEDYARQLEAQCQRYPLQWFNFFDFWHQPTAPLAPAATPSEKD